MCALYLTKEDSDNHIDDMVDTGMRDSDPTFLNSRQGAERRHKFGCFIQKGKNR